MIKVGEVEDTNGELISSINSNTFILKLDQVSILQKKSILTAVTFMHEAIHAEMRRFLYKYQDLKGSTLPGFPGNFSTDWKLYIKYAYGGDPTIMEHEAMAARYRSLIVNALQEYDNYALTKAQYKALAWEGLSGTMIYQTLSAEKRQIISDTYYDAIRQSTDSCN